MDRITLKTGQRIRMYCECDGHEWGRTRERRSTQKCVSGRLLPEWYSDLCPRCGLYKWTYTKKLKGVAYD